MKKLITIITVLFAAQASAINITASDMDSQEKVTEKFYQVSTLVELNKLARQCHELADNQDKQRICSSSYMDRKYSL